MTGGSTTPKVTIAAGGTVTLTGALSGTSGSFNNGLSINATQETWFSGYKVFQNNNTTLASYLNATMWLGFNYFTNSSGDDKYRNNGFATAYNQVNGQHIFYSAPSGTAGNTISFSPVLTLASTGAATFSSSVTAVTSGANSGFNTGALIAKSNGNNFRYTQVGYDNTSNYGWIQALEQGTAYTNLILNGAGGNVGIGTTTPTSYQNYRYLQINGASTTQGGVVRLGTSDNGYTSEFVVDNSGSFINSSDKFMIYAGGGSPRMTITSAGNVGIGTDTPLQTSSNRTAVTINGTTSAVFNLATSNTLRTYLYVDSSGSTFETAGTNTISASGANSIVFNTNGSPRAEINSSGYVGIVTSGYSLVNTFQLGRVFGFVQDINSGYIQANMANSGNYIVSQYAVRMHLDSAIGEINFLTAGSGTAGTSVSLTPRLKILNNGNVLINSTSDGSSAWKLQVVSPIATLGADSGLVYENRNNGSRYTYYATGGISYWFNGGNIAQINMTTGVFTPLSDKNKKKDFEISNIGLNEIMQLKPTLYRMKSDDSEGIKELGFIAQDVKQIIPNAYVESTDFIGLNFNPIVAALTKAVQELKEELDTLKNK
jgi:hypothetical protein